MNARQQLTTLFNQILSAPKDKPSADISDMERQIDELVYGLYRLKEEEIIIINK